MEHKRETSTGKHFSAAEAAATGKQHSKNIPEKTLRPKRGAEDKDGDMK